MPTPPPSQPPQCCRLTPHISLPPRVTQPPSGFEVLDHEPDGPYLPYQTAVESAAKALASDDPERHAKKLKRDHEEEVNRKLKELKSFFIAGYLARVDLMLMADVRGNGRTSGGGNGRPSGDGTDRDDGGTGHGDRGRGG